jgi:hypothetical protein
VSHSVFTGRVVEPGEPAFLPEDTDGAIALAEEERDTCPSCGMLKVWCRDPANQFATFEANEEQCHATFAVAAHRQAVREQRDEATSAAVQTSAAFRSGKKPDLMAGLDLPGEEHEPDDGAGSEQRH